MPYFLTRLNVGNYEAWKPQFDQDAPGARRDGVGHRLFRGIDDPGHVYILVEFPSAEAAQAGRERLLASGVLDRFDDKDLPVLVEEVDSATY